MRTRKELTKGSQRRLDELRKLARRDSAFEAVVDMYRYLDTDGEVVAHWYAWRDWASAGGPEGRFNPLLVGYDERELSFLRGRGLKGYVGNEPTRI